MRTVLVCNACNVDEAHVRGITVFTQLVFFFQIFKGEEFYIAVFFSVYVQD